MTTPAAELAVATTAWTDRWWDPDVGLVWLPPDPLPGPDGEPVVGEPGLHLLPQTVWYWLGLLLRDGPGDRARAEQLLGTVLDHQYDAPGTVWHGTFTQFHESAEPQPGAVMWVDYDPNWRQFIGCGLLLGLRRFGDRIPAHLVERTHAALVLIVDGEHGRLPDNYSNIALMHAYVQVEAGHRLDRPEWVASGEDRARRVVALYDRFGAFDEYNSPTYYGIDLLALGLWRGHSSSEVLAELGRRVEAALWRDSVRWYHAGLGNVAGPYTRAYGMDMGTCVSAWAMWVAAELGLDQAPMPPLDRPLVHGLELCMGPAIALVGVEVPSDARPDLEAFSGERIVTQRISAPEEGDRVATAWLGEDLMLGAESGTVDLSWWDQFHAATAHWRWPDGTAGWLRAMVPGPSDATVEPGRLTLHWHHGSDAAPDATARFRIDREGDDLGPLRLTSSGPAPEPVSGRPELRAAPGPGEVTTFVLERTA